MLVLNRRPGETIVIEPDFRVTVLSVTDRRVWIGLRFPGELPELRVSATVVSPSEARLEIVPMASVEFDGDRVRITTPADGDPAAASRAGLALDRKPGERVDVGDGVWIAVDSISKGNPTVTFGGGDIGDAFSITLIRPAGSYVRLGVDAPDRRVYREELWDVVRASGATRPASGTTGREADGAATAAPAPDAPVLEPAPEAPPIGEPVGHAVGAGDVTAGTAAG
jgi:sRNA-binding carbon storage regulator CsrA